MIGTLLIVLLILLIIGAIPNLGLHGYGYAPSGLLGLVLVVLLILFLMGRL